MQTTILLDLDGVLGNFVAAACAANDADDITHLWPEGKTGLHNALGVNITTFWEAIDAQGEAFWADMEPYPWTQRLWEFCEATADEVHILTSPSRNPQSLSGKLEWMYRFTGNDRYRNFLVGPQKHLCAKPGALLIDDRDSNCRKFRRAGGSAIVFPQPWNSNAEIWRDFVAKKTSPMDFIAYEVGRWQGLMGNL